ncbi:ABC spermidine/putrescine transporter, inner membrane subunit [Oceaniovalibus guishaninsula JLT2003]|uniref:ABC spermidine/putrescine transporter, inner membrane subunit n=1 Tax=Oceaniovalibus guishaninsula JLT2003 TaxID=1231392 RepID=K2HA51_9RHOB|nr:ABC transporter permease [Oceaniovalibus guishaninsula]EKE43512.1 ABC spermidine/putrescine transporter, inner membrane subunit [Oceaniovalibus guishaninsula JLT2003]
MGAGADRTERIRGWSLAAPPFVFALSLLAIPICTIMLFSFWTQDFLTLDRNLTLANYAEIATDPLYRQLLVRSILIAAGVTLATVLLAYPVAYFVSFHVPQERKSLWLFLITIPFWTSYLIRVFLWKVILGFNGVLNSALLGLGVIDEPLGWVLYNPTAVVITLAHSFAPFAILPIYVVLERIDRSLLEAGRDLGETRVTTFLRVTLPLSVPGIVAAVLIVFIPTIGDYVTPRLVGGPDGLMIANMIQTQFLRLNNAPMGAALSVVAMASVGFVAAIFTLALSRWLRAPR